MEKGPVIVMIKADSRVWRFGDTYSIWEDGDFWRNKIGSRRAWSTEYTANAAIQERTMSIESVTVTDTHGLLSLIKDSEGRNRGPVPEFAALLDPNGTHVLGFQMPHNDIEWRCRWFCKLANSDEPAEIWMDNGFDVFSSVTKEVNVEGTRSTLEKQYPV